MFYKRACRGTHKQPGGIIICEFFLCFYSSRWLSAVAVVRLRCLLTMTGYNDFSLTTRRYFIARPSLDVRIGTLRRRLNIILLSHSGGPIVPARTNSIILRHTHRALQTCGGVHRSITRLGNRASNGLQLNIVPAVTPCLLRGFVPTFIHSCPGIRLRVSRVVASSVIRTLGHSHVSTTLITDNAYNRKVLRRRLFGSHFFTCISPRGTLCRHSGVHVRSVSLHSLIVLDTKGYVHSRVVRLYRTGHSVPSRCSFRSNSLSALVHVISYASYLAVVPRVTIRCVPTSRHSQLGVLTGNTASHGVTITIHQACIGDSVVGTLASAVVTGTPRIKG